MSLTGLAIIYIIIWWIIFFAILPIDVERNKVIKIEGEDPGSPENPKMLKKFVYCTGITTVLFIIIYLLMKFEYLNLRNIITCLLYTSPSPRDDGVSRMPSSA